MGSDGVKDFSCLPFKVSIHAPAWGATKSIERHCRVFLVSIHAPARGATAAVSWPCRTFSFQSTLPRGERRKTGSTYNSTTDVSIHAPARGATICTSFNRSLMPSFQSTLPRGERHLHGYNSCPKTCFNPRSRAGSDTTFHLSVRRELVSIHAPARGATDCR